MMTRSIVGRFLILAVLLVSLGVIAQAALIISRGPSKALAKADLPPAARPAPAAPVAASAASAPAADAAQQAALQTALQAAHQAAQPADAAPAGDAVPVRVVYPGPLGDAAAAPRKIAAAAPAMPVQPAAAPAALPAPAAAVPAPTPAAAPAPAKPSPVVVASADADAQPTVGAPAAGTAGTAGKGGVNLNSASVDALNRLGGGHIGQTIVKHRPYTSVEDLVKKRVVRRSVYEQIKDQVAAQ